jgi:hypothetical protein
MKRLLLTTALLAAAHFRAHAFTINLDSELLKDESGTAMPISGLVVLTAGTSGSFYGPTPTSFIGGDEIMLKKWDFSAFATAGVLSDTTGDLSFTGAWNAGDPLRIYWYPTLTLASTAPGTGTKYGTYRDAVGIDGSAAWITGGPSDTVGLKFYTSDATFLNTGGSNNAAAGRANLTVGSVPEPTTPALSLLALLTFMGNKRRRQRVAEG